MRKQGCYKTILVLSNSFGKTDTLVKILRKHSGADEILFLGDWNRDFKTALKKSRIDFSDKRITAILGVKEERMTKSLSYGEEYPEFKDIANCSTWGNMKLGMFLSNNDSRDQLHNLARRLHCRIALYGGKIYHSDRQDGSVRMICPGSARWGNYCLIKTSESRVIKVEFHNLFLERLTNPLYPSNRHRHK